MRPWIFSGGSVRIRAHGRRHVLMRRIARGRQNSAAIISIEPIKDLRGIDSTARNIGSLVTLRQLATSLSLARYGSLRSAAAACGGWQTQNVGTTGGNICNASPASDLLPPLLVHGARVNLESAQGGRRTLALDIVYFGSGAHRIADRMNCWCRSMSIPCLTTRST